MIITSNQIFIILFYIILYLPTYSPDLNPIEHYWFKIKHEIRKVTPQFKDIART
ncbi:transposase [Orientia tsutsugamushi]